MYCLCTTSIPPTHDYNGSMALWQLENLGTFICGLARNAVFLANIASKS